MMARYPRDQWLRFNAAWRYLAAKQPARTVIELNIALEIDTQCADARSSRGCANLSLGNINSAVEDFEQFVDAQNRSAAPLASLAVAQSRAGTPTVAESLLSELAAKSGDRFVSSEAISKFSAQFVNIDVAFEFLEQACQAATPRTDFSLRQSGMQPAQG